MVSTSGECLSTFRTDMSWAATLWMFCILFDKCLVCHAEIWLLVRYLRLQKTHLPAFSALIICKCIKGICILLLACILSLCAVFSPISLKYCVIWVPAGVYPTISLGIYLQVYFRAFLAWRCCQSVPLLCPLALAWTSVRYSFVLDPLLSFRDLKHNVLQWLPDSLFSSGLTKLSNM